MRTQSVALPHQVLSVRFGQKGMSAEEKQLVDGYDNYLSTYLPDVFRVLEQQMDDKEKKCSRQRWAISTTLSTYSQLIRVQSPRNPRLHKALINGLQPLVAKAFQLVKSGLKAEQGDKLLTKRLSSEIILSSAIEALGGKPPQIYDSGATRRTH